MNSVQEMPLTWVNTIENGRVRNIADRQTDEVRNRDRSGNPERIMEP